MGIFTSAKAAVPQGPSAEEIASQEKAKQEKETLARIQEQESSRQKLRAQLAGEEEEGEITRKRLFGE